MTTNEEQIPAVDDGKPHMAIAIVEQDADVPTVNVFAAMQLIRRLSSMPTKPAIGSTGKDDPLVWYMAQTAAFEAFINEAVNLVNRSPIAISDATMAEMRTLSILPAADDQGPC